MAAPVDAGRATSGGTSGTPSVTLPGSIASGDLLVVLFAPNNNILQSVPTGWTKIKELQLISSSNLMGFVLVRVADGSEGTSLNITLFNSGSVKWSAVAWRITGSDTSTTPEISSDTSASSTTPDPLSLSPAGGSKDYLALWLGVSNNQPTMPPSGVPTNYSNAVGVKSGGTGSAASKSTAFGASRQLSGASSEDPPSWTIDTSSAWAAWTLMVYPSAAAATEDIFPFIGGGYFPT